ncbi:MAG: pyridoxamine 5'-phosphate oxidase family protein [Armatimonadetes bacterium]|nr:pyridoxamine 5'-phosphate oxidase family protein [Armatimonadota bacterium]
MDKTEIVNAALALVSAGRSFVLATVDRDGTPQVRWMGGAHLEEPFTIYMACGAESRKMGQIASDPRSQLMFQAEDFSRVATLTGTSEVVTEAEAKRRVFEGIAGAAQYFSGPDDPNFGAIKFTCRRVEVLGMSDGMGVDSAEL